MQFKPLLTLIVFTFILAGSAKAQQKLEGLVRDAQGNALPGATIKVKNSQASVLSDNNGRFSLNAAESLPFTLVISFVGFQDKDVEVTEISGKPFDISLSLDDLLENVVVTSRRRSEAAQRVPIPVTVVGGGVISDAGAFNVNRLKELVPWVQLYSSNPRNTTLNVRGLGSTFGLTNDGIDPGVGFYVDGVYYARPAATALDFIDVDRIEVLRGPQGTLFGKNTTAGAFNITTRKPSFTPGGVIEASFGNFGYIQAKASITGALGKKIAGRLSFSGTQRDGVLENIVTGKKVNDINNLGVRGQLLIQPNDKTSITIVGDATRQRPDGYAQVIAGVVQTKRADYRQFANIIADLNYSLPTTNPFDRKIDHNTPWRSGNDLGGVAVNLDTKIGGGTLTSTTAWRYWNWDPSNDRDFTALPVLTLSQATSKHKQWSQEVRYAGDFSSKLSGVFGVYLIGQDLKTDPEHIEESGSAQWRFSQSSKSDLWKTPGLLDGYGIKTKSRLQTFSAAVFGQLDWSITETLHVLPGIRYNYDEKDVDYDRQTYGGLQTDDPALIAIKNSVYTNQAFKANTADRNFSGQVTVAYKPNKRINAYGTYSTNFKPVGVNLGGLPTAGGDVLIDLAVIKPEKVRHYEVGLKTNPALRTTLNITFFNTEIKDYQTQVQTAEVGVNRGYLANAEKVRVRGVELEGSTRLGKYFSFAGGLAYTEGKYISFTNAPVPLEETGATNAFKDISGGDLPGISKWTFNFRGEFEYPAKFLGKSGNFFTAFDTYYRSDFSSSASPSKYLNIDGYALVNGRIGVKVKEGASIFVWGRNLLDKNYFEQLLPAAGNAGHYAAVLGDQRTYGVTLRYSF